MRTFEDPALFFVAYIVMLLPTYALQIMGLDPSLVTAGLTGRESEWNSLMIPYVTFFALVLVVTWLRGQALQRRWLIALPSAAWVLSLFPLTGWEFAAPIVVHCITVVVGLFPKRAA
jgi:hypothetical protein